MEKPVVDFSLLPSEVLDEYNIQVYSSYEEVFNDLYLDDNEVSRSDIAELLKNKSMQEVVEAEPYMYKFGDKYYRFTDMSLMPELAEKYPEAVFADNDFELPWVKVKSEPETVYKGNYAEVRQQIMDAYHSDDIELAMLLNSLGTNLSLSDAFQLYADLRQEIDGDKTLCFLSSGEIHDVGAPDLISPEEMMKRIADYVPKQLPEEHLREFLADVVPFRLMVNDIDVSEENVSLLVDALMSKGYGTFLDNDQIDSILVEKYFEITGVDKTKVDALRAGMSNLRHEINGAASNDPDLLPELEKYSALLDIQHSAAVNGVKVNLDTDKIIDLDHLNCLWYGGVIGSLEYKGYTVSVEVHGDVNVSVLSEKYDDVLCEYKNKNNSGVQSHEILKYIGDDSQLEALASEGRLAWENNNWVEFVVLDKDGNVVDTPMVETVLDDNILDAFDDVSFYKNLIDEIEQKQALIHQEACTNDKLFILDDEIMINDDNESINCYLWAVDGLVDRLPDSEHMENINFYADYNVKTGELKLTSTYDTPVEDGELNKEFEVVLSENEKTALLSKISEYCQREYSQSCLEFVNELRERQSLPLIEVDGSHPSLAQQLQDADSLKDKEVVKQSGQTLLER